MTLHSFDLAIIGGYLLLTLGLGIWIAQRASGTTQAYFLAGRKLPWYVLGLSNASGMFDVSGTMWMVGLLVVYGLKSVFIPWLWPVFNQIFLMAFLAVWLRRSNRLTGAEWISFRFGEDMGARASHLINVAFALIIVAGYIAFSFLGIGKLAAEFIPHSFSTDPELNGKIYGLIIVGLTTVYVVKGGFYSVVITELLQYALMLLVCIVIAIMAMQAVSSEMLRDVVPEGWHSLFVGPRLGLNWQGLASSESHRVVALAADARISADGYSAFGIIVGLMLFKGIFQSMAGPAPNYDMQRLLSARSPVEAAKVSGFVNVVLLFPRYLMIAGLGVLALCYIGPEWTRLQAVHGADFTPDFETVLPFALKEFIPVGLLGLVLAGLLAAFMSSFSASLNAAPAYVVNDLYRKYIGPDAPEKTYVRLSYVISGTFAVIGVFIGWQLTSIGHAINFIAVGLYGGYTAANMLKWYWWRLNGTGYALSMGLGIFLALIIAHLGGNELQAFPVVFAACVAVAVVGSYLTPATDIETLKIFYRQTRPWGLWRPVLRACQAEDGVTRPNRDFVRDMGNVAVGIVWQTAIAASAIFLVIHDYVAFAACLGVVAACTLLLKFIWWDRLSDAPE